MVAVDDTDFEEQFIMTYNLTNYADIIASGTSKIDGAVNPVYQDSYMTGLTLTFAEAGTHTLTFRAPYDFNGVSGLNGLHIRDIYMVKSAD
jgi:hypothetical protein